MAGLALAERELNKAWKFLLRFSLNLPRLTVEMAFFHRRNLASAPCADRPKPAVGAGRLTLRTAPVGCPLIVRELRADSAACLRLRELGFCEAARISKLTDQGNLICQVCGVRIALNGRLGDLVIVEPVAALPA